MLESLKTEAFEYQRLSPEEMASRKILGRLVGPCADIVNPTRNGRGYTEKLWENVFDDPIVNEKISNKCLFGEMGHPENRTEVDLEKIALALNEKPKKNKNGELMAVFDILDTPNGRILKTLCDYGTNIGISSRGTGEVIDDDRGNEIVDPDTYQFECFDAVIVPAVESARMKYVSESLDSNKLNLRKALRESLDSASEEDRKIMKEKLDELNIDVGQRSEEEGVNPEGEEHKDEAEGGISEQTVEKTEEANDDGSDEIIKSLQEALKAKSELEEQVRQLQERLAVSDAKAGKLEESVRGYKSTTVKMSSLVTENKGLQSKVSSLEEELNAKEKTVESQRQRIAKLVSEKKEGLRKGGVSGRIDESLAKKDAEIRTLNENFDEIRKGYESRIKELTESIDAMKSDSESKDKELMKRLNDETRLKESYVKLANSTMKAYIESKATMLGIDAAKIIERLPKQCAVSDVDSVCEELQSYELNMNKLPFSVDRKVKVRVNKSTNESLRPNPAMDDDVDESLYRLAKLI